MTHRFSSLPLKTGLPARLVRLASLSPLMLPLFAGIACGGASQEAAAPPEAAETKSATAEQPDVSAVPAPSGLVVFGRVSKPADLLQTGSGWAGVALPPDMLSRLTARADLAKAQDASKPFDFAVASDPKGSSPLPGLALSLALKPLDQSKPVLEKSFVLHPGKNGVIRLEAKHAADDDDDEGGARHCAAYPAADAPLRLVCGTSRGMLETLGSYLARTTPRASYPSDVHMDLTLAPYREMLTQARGTLPTLIGGILGTRKGDNPALSELVGAVMGDLVDFAIDLDKISFDAKASDPGAEGTLNLSFKGSDSLLARLAVSHPERADAPPPAFWRMPASSDGVFFNGAIDEKNFAHPRDVLVDALTKGLSSSKTNVSEADKGAIKNSITHLFSLFASPGVHARGIDEGALQAALQSPPPAAGKDGKDGKEARREERAAIARQLAGWSITSFDAPPETVTSTMKELSAVLSRPAIAKQLRELQHGDNPPINAPPATFKLVPSKLASTLPKGSSHFELTVVPTEEKPESKTAKSEPKAGAKPAPKAAILDKPVKLHLFVVPDGPRTLLGYGFDDALLAKTLAGVVSSTATLETAVAQREGLADLKAAKMNSGGFIDVRSFVAGTPLKVLFGHETDVREAFRQLGASPSHGTALIPFSAAAQAGKDGNAGSCTASFKVPKAAIQDIVAVALH